MATTISQRELRNDSGQVMAGLDRGESYVITRNGVPVGELRPVRRRAFVPAAVALAAFADLPTVDYRQLRRDLDAHAVQSIEPRA